MTKQISNHAAAAKMIRAELKQYGIKARVKASAASMTSSVDVYILEDILPATKKAITEFVDRFQYGHFDGMTDCYEYSNKKEDLPQVKFVFVHVEYSDEIKADVRNYLGETGNDYNADMRVHQTLCGVYCPDFWNSRKPVVRVDNLINNTPVMLRLQAD